MKFDFLKFLKLFSICTRFQISSSSLSENLGGTLTSSSRQQFSGQNIALRIGFIKLIEQSDTFNYEAYFKHNF